MVYFITFIVLLIGLLLSLAVICLLITKNNKVDLRKVSCETSLHITGNHSHNVIIYAQCTARRSSVENSHNKIGDLL